MPGRGGAAEAGKTQAVHGEQKVVSVDVRFDVIVVHGFFRLAVEQLAVSC